MMTAYLGLQFDSWALLVPETELLSYRENWLWLRFSGTDYRTRDPRKYLMPLQHQIEVLKSLAVP